MFEEKELYIRGGHFEKYNIDFKLFVLKQKCLLWLSLSLHEHSFRKRTLFCLRLIILYITGLRIVIALLCAFCTYVCYRHCDLQIICNDYPTFQFQFVNSFLSLFYIAFYLQDQERLKEVRIQLFFLRCVITT